MLDRKKPNVAELIRETRHQLELSQVEFARQLGVSFHSVNRWENRRTCFSPLALKQIDALLHPIESREKIG